MKVISGFQTGADIAGVKAAKKCGIETGGFIPKGWRTENGAKPHYKSLYNAVETETYNYKERTYQNVYISDCTIIFDYIKSTGSLFTKKCCEDLRKPYLYLVKNDIDNFNDCLIKITTFLQSINNDDIVINIAGNRESKAPNIEKIVYNILIKIFQSFPL